MEQNENEEGKKKIGIGKIILIGLVLLIFIIWGGFRLVFFAGSIVCIWYIWKKAIWSKGKKSLATAGAIILTIIVLASSGGSDSADKPTQENNAQTTQAVNQDEAKAEIKSQPKKEDEVKLKFTKPVEDSIEVTEDAYEIAGSVASSDVAVEMSKKNSDNPSEAVPVDSDGNFNIKVTLQKESNTFDFIAKKGDQEKSESLLIFRKITEEERKAELKADAKTIPYKELFRNIDKYKGEKIHYTGEVVQVIGDGNALSSMRVNITRGSYGYWDDTVLVTSIDLNAEKTLEKDIIEFWGTVIGEESYQTVLGATVSLPSLSASVIELVK